MYLFNNTKSFVEEEKNITKSSEKVYSFLNLDILKITCAIIFT